MNWSRIGRLLSGASVLLTILATPVLAAEAGDQEQDYFEGRAEAGYRFFSTRDEPTRAAEYTLTESSPTLGLHLSGVKDHGRFFLDGSYLNESDFRAEADLDFRGLVRLTAFGERLYHNLEHFPYADRPAAVDPLGEEVVTFSDLDPGDDYHVEVTLAGARLRGKYPGFPAHLNLGYWRLEREGEKQLRFLSESCTGCHEVSRSRDLKRVTDEVTAGFDLHLGPVDLVFEQLFREFRDREAIPVDTFDEHMLRTGPAAYQHDEDPDARLRETSFKAHTSLAGGLVGSAGYAFGRRENRSDLTDVAPVEAETDFQKTTGDVTYTPNQYLTFSFRYRLLDLDSSNSDRINADGLVFSGADHNPVDVRDSIDLTRASYHALAALRPSARLTLKGEFQREEIHRSDTGGPQEFNAFVPVIVIDPVWELPEDETIDTWRLSAYSRPLGHSRLKLNGWYQYRTSDDPAYATSAERSHEGFAGAAWKPVKTMELFGNLNLRSDRNTENRIFLADGSGGFSGFDLDRRQDKSNVTAGFWLTPAEALTLNFTYGFLRTKVTEDLLFGMDVANGMAIVDNNVEYRQRVHSAVLSGTWQMTPQLRSRFEGRLIDSFAEFSPDFATGALAFSGFEAPVDSDSLQDLSALDIRQTGLQLGLDWTTESRWTYAAVYSYDDYRDRNGDLFDGTVQTALLSVARSW